MSKTADIASFREKLANNAIWAIRGMLRIFQNQTTNEQDMESTEVDNGIGFTGVDAKLLTSFSKQVNSKIDWLKSKNLPIYWDRLLSEKQMKLVFKKMPKYAKQLYSVSHTTSKAA